MFELNFKLQWDEKDQGGVEALLQTALPRLEEDLKNWAPAFRLIGRDILEPFAGKQLKKGDAEHGAPGWAPASSHRPHNRHHALLQKKHASSSWFDDGVQEHLREITGSKLRWGSKAPYERLRRSGAGVRRAGGAIGRGAQRPAPTEAIGERMRSALVQRLAQAARREGWRVTVE